MLVTEWGSFSGFTDTDTLASEDTHSGDFIDVTMASKDTHWRLYLALSCDSTLSEIVKGVEIVKEGKRSDGLWHFATGNFSFHAAHKVRISVSYGSITNQKRKIKKIQQKEILAVFSFERETKLVFPIADNRGSGGRSCRIVWSRKPPQFLSHFFPLLWLNLFSCSSVTFLFLYSFIIVVSQI